MESTLDKFKTIAAGHSSIVRMYLHFGDASFVVVQSGGTEIKLKDDAKVPSGPAILEISVDGESDRREVVVDANGPRPGWRFLR